MLTDKANLATANKYKVAYCLFIGIFTFDHDLFSCTFWLSISRRWWQIGQTLLFATNKKSQVGFWWADLYLTSAHSKGQGDPRLNWISFNWWQITPMLLLPSIIKSNISFRLAYSIWPWPILKVNWAVGTVWRQICWNSYHICEIFLSSSAESKGLPECESFLYMLPVVLAVLGLLMLFAGHLIF